MNNADRLKDYLYYQDDAGEIYCGDCLEIMPLLSDKSISTVLTDPPYNIRKAEWDKWKTKEAYVEWCGKWLLEVQRVTKDNGLFYFFHNDMPQIAMLMEWIRQNTAFVFKSIITIDKLDNTYIKDIYGTQNHFRNYLNLAEYCLFYTFQDETGLTGILPLCFKPYLDYMTQEKNKANLSIKDCNSLTGYVSIASHWFWQEPQKEQPQPRFIQPEDYKKLQTTGFFQRPYEDLRREYEDLRREYEDLRREYEDLRYTFNAKDGKKNVWAYSFREEQRFTHNTQKPAALIENIIKDSSNEKHLILDPFLGSGTTAVACKRLNRRFIGIEISEKYCEIAKNRLQIKEAINGKG